MKIIKLVHDSARYAKGTVGATKEEYTSIQNAESGTTLEVSDQKGTKICTIPQEVFGKLKVSPSGSGGAVSIDYSIAVEAMVAFKKNKKNEKKTKKAKL